MQTDQPSLPMRDDTILGVCQGLGEDLGFSPNFLRIGFAVLLLWSPVSALVGYAAAGVVVLLSRLLFPNQRRAATPLSAKAAAGTEPAAPLAADDRIAEQAEFSVAA